MQWTTVGRRPWIPVGALVCLVLSTALEATVTSQTPEDELKVFVGELQTLSPGFAMGNIVLADPAVAGYEPNASRREMLLRGKKVGTTSLSIWDQKGALRRQITLHVTTREASQTEGDLRALLKAYPGVEIHRLAGGLVVTGTVSSNADLQIVERLTSAAKAKSAVRVAFGSVGTGTAPAPGVPSGEPSTSAAVVEFEVELFEASTQFATGSYARGVEPSGRSLYRERLRAPIGGETTVFIGGRAVAPPTQEKSGKGKKQTSPNEGTPEPGAETGIRLTLRPAEPTQSGTFRTDVLVETNVPISYDLYDPDGWRRSRWNFTARLGEPFGIAGSDLLASPEVTSSSAMGRASRTAGTVARVPGVSGRPGVDYVPVFGSLFRSNSYSKKRTQLLVVLRPRVAGPSLR